FGNHIIASQANGTLTVNFYEIYDYVGTLLTMDIDLYNCLKKHSKNPYPFPLKTKLEDLLKRSSLTHAKLFLQAIKTHEPLAYQDIKDTIKDIVMEIRARNYPIKTLLFMFQEFQGLFPESILEEMVSAALSDKQFMLVDILLHKYKIRLIRPTSKEHEQQLYLKSYNKLMSSPEDIRETYLKRVPLSYIHTNV
ncbi:hypothetical protein CYY_010501, partial [Polysphondylium violaceum]